MGRAKVLVEAVGGGPGVDRAGMEVVLERVRILIDREGHPGVHALTVREVPARKTEDHVPAGPEDFQDPAAHGRTAPAAHVPIVLHGAMARVVPARKTVARVQEVHLGTGGRTKPTHRAMNAAGVQTAGADGPTSATTVAVVRDVLKTAPTSNRFLGGVSVCLRNRVPWRPSRAK